MLTREQLATRLFEISTATTQLFTTWRDCNTLELTAIKRPTLPLLLDCPFVFDEHSGSNDAIVLACSRSTVFNLASEYNVLGVVIEACNDCEDHPWFMPSKLFETTFHPLSQPCFVPLTVLYPGYSIAQHWDDLTRIFVDRLSSDRLSSDRVSSDCQSSCVTRPTF